MEPLVLDSATRLGADAAEGVAICGSHGGLYPAWLAARAGLRGVILNDAGIAGVLWLDGLGIAACAADYRSARIGDGADMLASGRISSVNETAARHGCLPGLTCLQAARCFIENAQAVEAPVPEIGETRTRIASTGHRAVWALDSVSLARADDRRAIVVTGSHGALLGGRADHVLEVDVFAAFFNDAGGGKEGAGFSRLASLDARGIAAATASHQTARIGDGRSTYDTGVISHANETARRLDVREGMSVRNAVARLVGLG